MLYVSAAVAQETKESTIGLAALGVWVLFLLARNDVQADAGLKAAVITGGALAVARLIVDLRQAFVLWLAMGVWVCVYMILSWRKDDVQQKHEAV